MRTLAAPIAPLSFDDVRLIQVDSGWKAEFRFDGEELCVHAREREELEGRLRAMQLALFTVPADQWREIKAGGTDSYELPRADGSGFVVTHSGEGLPYFDGNVSDREARRVGAPRLQAPGVHPPMLAPY